MLKRKVIGILLGITVFLLLVNSVVEIFTLKEPTNAIPGYSVSEAEQVLFSTNNSFGILPEWIKVINKKFPEQDSLKHSINISIPPDLPIPVLIRDLKNNYPDSLQLVTNETKKFGNTLVKLFRGEIQLLNVTFEYKEGISRPYCSLSFVMAPIEEIDEPLLERIIKNNFPFSLSIVPSFANEKEIVKLTGLDKNYIVLLNDEIQDNLFKLSTTASTRQLKGAVSGILNSFGKEPVYLIDQTSEIYNSASMNFIRDEFRKNEVQLHSLSGLVNLTEKDQNEISSLIKFYCTSSPADTCINMYMKIEDYLDLEEVIGVYKKRGHNIKLLNWNAPAN